ncbi:hypothetical protein GP486_002708 [Trichoglossum hirsutum]|uniref:2-hydroxyacyl-CoA lyase n=1 Tax=Trichoglossum hirsutum TaxID=265104 RepID=A0A9P8RRV6_9PEZI|nr:hypothetical protein GP486_002708 [Trichoglossum hirsutum]
MPSLTGAQIIACALRDLDVDVLFGIVGIPVVEIAEEALNLGIKYIGFRNEQAASYAASVYGYLTGKPGVGNSSANAFPLLLLAGSSESHLTSRGAFQELDAISLLTPHTKLSVRPVSPDLIPSTIANAYRCSFYGRPGTGFVDFPADLIQGLSSEQGSIQKVVPPPKGGAQRDRVLAAARLLKGAKAPLVVVGKGSAYARAEAMIRELIEKTSIQFLPTPMGKGVLPDSHPNNVASARSTALKFADVVLVLGARLNWILHFGDAPKWNPNARIIQVDISAEEIGRNHGDASLGLVGDIAVVTEQLLDALNGWRWHPRVSDYAQRILESKRKNEVAAAAKAKVNKTPMSYERSFSIIKTVLDRLSPPQKGGIVYVSEGANTMDISRSIFTVEQPRLRLDAGTYATMGIGMGYAIAAHVAYNGSGNSRAAKKKIVALEGDSAFGFSAMEVETMARYQMDVLIFVINNGGVYHGDSLNGDEWLKLQQATVEGVASKGEGLRSWSLGWEVGYEKIAEACGGKGFIARTPEELARATEEGFKAKVPVVINVIIEAGQATKLVGSHIPLLVSWRF